MSRLERFTQKQKTGIIAAIILVTIGIIFGLSALFSGNQNNNVPMSTESDAPQAYVTIRASGFEPSTLYVKPGTKVIWKNEDVANHTLVTSSTQAPGVPAAIHSDAILPSFSHTVVLSDVGRYSYNDSANDKLTGLIIVDQADSTSIPNAIQTQQ